MKCCSLSRGDSAVILPWVGTGVSSPGAQVWAVLAPMWSRAQREVTSSDAPPPPRRVCEHRYPAFLLNGHLSKPPSFSLKVQHHKFTPRISVAIAPNLLWLASTARVLRSSDGRVLPLELILAEWPWPWPCYEFSSAEKLMQEKYQASQEVKLGSEGRRLIRAIIQILGHSNQRCPCFVPSCRGTGNGPQVHVSIKMTIPLHKTFCLSQASTQKFWEHAPPCTSFPRCSRQWIPVQDKPVVSVTHEWNCLTETCY